MLTEFIILLALIILNGIFSMSEIAIISSRKSKLEAESEEGNKNAEEVLKILESPTRFLSTVQVGITLIGILTGVFGGATLTDFLAEWLKQYQFVGEYSHGLALLIVVLLITYFTLVLGELVPKRIGLTNPEKIAGVIAFPMRFLELLASPAVWLLSHSTDAILKALGVQASKENVVTEEEIKALMKEASNVGEVEKEEHDIVERVFFLGDTEVGSLMTNRMDLVALDINEGIDENKKIIAESVYTNFPVYENDLDNVIGVLNIKHILTAWAENKSPDLKNLLEKPLFVPETMKAFKLMETMKGSKTHFAIAVDEHGSVKGVVTVNDLFQALVGNLYNDHRAPEIVERADGSFLVDGLISLDEFYRYFDIEDTEEIDSQGFFTLGGLVLYITKHIPSVAEKFTWKDLTFEIIDMDGARVDKILVTKI